MPRNGTENSARGDEEGMGMPLPDSLGPDAGDRAPEGVGQPQHRAHGQLLQHVALPHHPRPQGQQPAGL